MNDLRARTQLDQVPESPPDQEPLSGADLLHVYARPGVTCTVADDRGVCIELHVKVASGDAFVTSAIGDRLRRGARVSGRVYDGEAVQTLVFAVEEIEETGGGRADGLLRLIETAERGDERRDLRHDYDAAARLTAGGDLHARVRPAGRAGAHLRRLALRYGIRPPTAASRPARTSTCTSRTRPALDRCRIQVLRAERAVYGSTRYASRILTISEIDQLRLDHLCNRCRLREEALPDEAAEAYRSESCSPRAAGRAASVASSAALTPL